MQTVALWILMVIPMTEKERYKLVYKDEDAWEHEWDIEDTVNHIAIFQQGKMIVDELNKLNNENEQLKRQNRRRKRKLKAHRTVITELGEVIMGYKGLIKTLKEDKKLLEQENNQLKKQLDGICKSYSDYYGMNIRNAPWYGFIGDVE